MSNQPQVYVLDLERRANTPIPEGIHQFVVKNIEEGESSNQNPMWTVTLACETPGEEGKEVRMFLVLTDSARWKLEGFLDAVRAPATGKATASQFIGRRLRAQITHEDYNGRAQARVGEMFPITPITSTPSATLKPVAVGSNPRPASKKTAPPKELTQSPEDM